MPPHGRKNANTNGCSASREGLGGGKGRSYCKTRRAQMLKKLHSFMASTSACQPELALMIAVCLRAARFKSAPADQPARAPERRLE